MNRESQIFTSQGFIRTDTVEELYDQKGHKQDLEVVCKCKKTYKILYLFFAGRVARFPEKK